MTVSSCKSKAALGLSLAVAVALLGAASTFTPQPARAQMAVACVNCSNVATQAMEYARQLLQYAKQIQEYQLQIQQYEDQIRNSVRLPQAVFDDALVTLRGIESMMAYGQNIRYSMTNLNWEFQQRYPDVFRTYHDLHQVRDIWQAMEQDWNRQVQTYDSAKTALMAAREHSRELQYDQYRMDRVGRHLTDASGRLDAMQAAGEYAQHSAQQLMKLRQVALVQIQMAATAQADAERKAMLARAAAQIWVEDRPSEPQHTPNTSQDYRR